MGPGWLSSWQRAANFAVSGMSPSPDTVLGRLPVDEAEIVDPSETNAIIQTSLPVSRERKNGSIPIVSQQPLKHGSCHFQFHSFIRY